LKKDALSEEKVIARVGDVNLLESDLMPVYTSEMSSEDSALVASSYLENWARKQILFQKAKLNLPKKKEQEFKKMIAKYKNDLYTNYYREALISGSFDTVVSSSAVQDFYKENQNVFRLNEELLQYKLLSFPSTVFDDKKVKKLFLKADKESVEKLLEDELKFSKIQLNDSVWFSYIDLIKTTQIIKQIDKKKFLKKNSFFQLKDSVNTYLIKLNKVLNRNDVAPLEYVYPVVKQMLLHKKKLEYIKEIEHKLIEDAIQSNTYEKY